MLPRPCHRSPSTTFNTVREQEGVKARREKTSSVSFFTQARNFQEGFVGLFVLIFTHYRKLLCVLFMFLFAKFLHLFDVLVIQLYSQLCILIFFHLLFWHAFFMSSQTVFKGYVVFYWLHEPAFPFSSVRHLCHFPIFYYNHYTG